jgi:colanic acid biosynthesis glycosyl transferase WcaI
VNGYQRGSVIGQPASNVRAKSINGIGAQAPKLVFVNRYFAPDESATSRMVSDLAFRLVERGVPVSVVTSRQLYENSCASLPSHQVLKGVNVYRVPTATRGRSRLAGRALDYASFHAAAGLKVLSLLSRGDVVVAKTDPPLISMTVACVAAWKGALLVNWLQDLFPEVASALTPDLLPKWLEGLLLSARDRSLRGAAINVVLSDGMRQRLLSRKIDNTRIRIVPNWADVTNVTPIPTRDSRTRHKLGLADRFVVGYSGNLGRAHEFETLIGAARLLCADRRFAFLITGSGAKAGSLQSVVRAENLENFVFQDYQPPELLSDSLAAADVHLVSLLPALEGLIVPSKIYGILAAGRPTVFIGDAGGDLARMVRDHGCGIAVGVGESEQLAARLRELQSDAARHESMGRNARRLATERYTSERAVEDWIEFLNGIAPSVAHGVTDPVL